MTILSLQFTIYPQIGVVIEERVKTKEGIEIGHE
jgi:hypothetical protein